VLDPSVCEALVAAVGGLPCVFAQVTVGDLDRGLDSRTVQIVLLGAGLFVRAEARLRGSPQELTEVEIRAVAAIGADMDLGLPGGGGDVGAGEAPWALRLMLLTPNRERLTRLVGTTVEPVRWDGQSLAGAWRAALPTL
jgi:hypothetical protein